MSDIEKFLIERYNLNYKDWSGRDYKMFLEWRDLDAYIRTRRNRCEDEKNPPLSYSICKTNVSGIPTEYEICFRCKSIVGVVETGKPREPVFGYLHKMSIVLPNNYPSADGNPIFIFRTDVWHPNIRYSGPFKGHVCLAQNELGVLCSLKDLVIRAEQYLKYQLYHAQNTYPYPEDQNVAEWVREEAEPNGWTKF